MNPLSSLFAAINPWVGLIVQSVTMVETVAAQAPVKPASQAKLQAAVGAVQTGLAALPAVSAEVTNVQTALASNDPTTITTALSHGVEMALSICKAFGIFSKAGVVQNAAQLDPPNIGGG